MLVEGYEELVLALDAGSRPTALYYCEELIKADDERALIGRAGALGAELVRLARPVFARVAYRESPDGWLAVVPSVDDDLATLRLTDNPLLLVCAAVEKPGNLGAMLRTADAAGLDAVIAADPIADWSNPNIVRASKATLFSVPVASATSPILLRWLREHSIRVVATTPDTTTPFTDADYRGPTAIVVGSEKDGLSPAWLEQADDRVRIPMCGLVNSINVATSAALVAYEALRQRSARLLPPASDPVAGDRSSGAAVAPAPRQR